MEILSEWVKSSCISGAVETSVPCCIRHVEGQTTPTLKLPYMEPYSLALEHFRNRQPGQDFIDKKCKALASKISDTSYTIPSKAEGEESIRELVRRHSVRETITN
jgi:hypothetical protein